MFHDVFMHLWAARSPMRRISDRLPIARRRATAKSHKPNAALPSDAKTGGRCFTMSSCTFGRLDHRCDGYPIVFRSHAEERQRSRISQMPLFPPMRKPAGDVSRCLHAPLGGSITDATDIRSSSDRTPKSDSEVA